MTMFGNAEVINLVDALLTWDKEAGRPLPDCIREWAEGLNEIREQFEADMSRWEQELLVSSTEEVMPC